MLENKTKSKSCVARGCRSEAVAEARRGGWPRGAGALAADHPTFVQLDGVTAAAFAAVAPEMVLVIRYVGPAQPSLCIVLRRTMATLFAEIAPALVLWVLACLAHISISGLTKHTHQTHAKVIFFFQQQTREAHTSDSKH